MQENIPPPSIPTDVDFYKNVAENIRGLMEEMMKAIAKLSPDKSD